MAFTLLRLVLAALPANAPATPAAAARPSLLVVITVDQLAADHVDRFGGQFTGGLARLLAGGAVFSRAGHDHAITETAPGHATLLSGRYPRSTGITANLFGVADPERPLL
ncbi:MAG: alkaline phosphatase family protein, partial [Gemmatimonadota bacterium]